ncbi:MAG: hypothetical protein LBH65_02395 [Desulfovibrio sp.]|jgi:Mor family transcriptional regulator|nr:hypothetical protein [Desulfovibrio sp.]
MSGSSRLGLELLDEIETMTNEILAARPENPGRELAERLRLHYGGQQLYIPLGRAADTARRNAAIFDEFTGDNHADLVKRHNLAISTIYDILRLERARRREKQSSLPGGGGL